MHHQHVILEHPQWILVACKDKSKAAGMCNATTAKHAGTINLIAQKCTLTLLFVMAVVVAPLPAAVQEMEAKAGLMGIMVVEMVVEDDLVGLMHSKVCRCKGKQRQMLEWNRGHRSKSPS